MPQPTTGSRVLEGVRKPGEGDGGGAGSQSGESGAATAQISAIAGLGSFEVVSRCSGNHVFLATNLSKSG